MEGKPFFLLVCSGVLDPPRTVRYIGGQPALSLFIEKESSSPIPCCLGRKVAQYIGLKPARCIYVQTPLPRANIQLQRLQICLRFIDLSNNTVQGEPHPWAKNPTRFCKLSCSLLPSVLRLRVDVIHCTSVKQHTFNGKEKKKKNLGPGPAPSELGIQCPTSMQVQSPV